MIPVPSALFSALALKLIVAAGCAFLLILLINDRNRWKARTSEYAAVIASERNAHLGTVAGYRAAAEQARREDAQNIARVKASQAAINERTAHDFESRIAAARASYQRLLGSTQGSTADTGTGRAAPMPGLPASAGRAAQGAGQDGFSQSDRLIATEQAIQLDELIKWVQLQAQVDMQGR
jgi:hypothetical protein